MPEFTFKPSHTLFIDASLQAQDDADLIGREDRVNNEWIMDAVTHQPLCKQSAVKGRDGIFFWNLNVAAAVTPLGVMPPQTQFVGNLRENYDVWFGGMKSQSAVLIENNPMMSSLLAGGSRFLVGVTRPKNIKRWGRMGKQILDLEERKKHALSSAVLSKGEVRLEIVNARLNKLGLARLAAFMPSASQGDALVLLKSFIPGDNPPEHTSEVFPMKAGFVKFKGRSAQSIDRRFITDGRPFERAELNDILEDQDPQRSQVRVKLCLAAKNGSEMRGEGGQLRGLLGEFKVSLKELVRDGTADSHGSFSRFRCRH